jgi:hypothetical protein
MRLTVVLLVFLVALAAGLNRLLGIEALDLQIACSQVETTSSTQVEPTAPEPAAKQDPNRVVATIDGKPITAQQATNMLNTVAPQARRQYESRLPDLVQQLFMQSQIAAEAVKLHLDRQAPWNVQLGHACVTITKQACTGYDRTGAGVNVPRPLQLQWINARQRILWNAYFGQASTAEERQALLKQKREQYKIQVQDPDFFKSGP